MDNELPEPEYLYLYRSIKLEYLELYKNNPSEIPYLEGKYFKQYNHLNPYPYEDEVRYMHFFDEREMAKGYAKNSSEEGDFMAPHIVCVFKFPKEILKSCRTDGLFGFESTIGRNILEAHNEYIIPAQIYNPAEHFVGVLEKSPISAPNVYAVVSRDEVDKFATDISSVDGREYMGEYSYLDDYVKSYIQKGDIAHGSKNLKRVLSNLESEIKAIEMFSKKEAAEASLKSHFSINPDNWSIRIMDAMSGANSAFYSNHTIIPFYVDPSVLEQFKIGESIRGGNEYLIPIQYLTEENYYETGNEWIDNPENTNLNKKE